MPTLVLVAGPNGSGKSTIASRQAFQDLFKADEAEAPLHIDPDEVLKKLALSQPDRPRRELEILAAQQADDMLAGAIADGRSVIRETVLSTDRLIKYVGQAKTAGYRFALFFVLLRNVETNVARVKQRVAMGGHDVPESKIVERWARSLSNLPVFAAFADLLYVFDNTDIADPGEWTAGPALLFEATAEEYYIDSAVHFYALISSGPLAEAMRTLTTLISSPEAEGDPGP